MSARFFKKYVVVRRSLCVTLRCVVDNLESEEVFGRPAGIGPDVEAERGGETGPVGLLGTFKWVDARQFFAYFVFDCFTGLDIDGEAIQIARSVRWAFRRRPFARWRLFPCHPRPSCPAAV